MSVHLKVSDLTCQPVRAAQRAPVDHDGAAHPGAEEDGQEGVRAPPRSEDRLGVRRGAGILEQRRRQRDPLLQSPGEGGVPPQQVGSVASDARGLVDHPRRRDPEGGGRRAETERALLEPAGDGDHRLDEVVLALLWGLRPVGGEDRGVGSNQGALDRGSPDVDGEDGRGRGEGCEGGFSRQAGLRWWDRRRGPPPPEPPPRCAPPPWAAGGHRLEPRGGVGPRGRGR